MSEEFSLNQIKRQWLLLTIVPQPPSQPKSTDKIRQMLIEQSGENFSKRMIERDLQALAEEFDIGFQPEGKTNYWSWNDVPRMWLPGLRPEQALAFYMIEQNLKDLLPEATLQSLAPFFRAAEEMLNETQSGRRSWKQKFRLIESRQMLKAPKLSTDATRMVRSALLEDRAVRITYRDRSDQQDFHESVLPLAITQRGAEQYLIYRKLDDTSPQFLPMQRIKSATHSLIDVPKANFDIDAYLASEQLGFGKQYPIAVGKKIKLEATFTKKTAERLAETPLAENQVLIQQEDGFVMLKAEVKFSGQLLWWILSYGQSIEVLKPVTLRNLVARTLKSASEIYAVTG